MDGIYERSERMKDKDLFQDVKSNKRGNRGTPYGKRRGKGEIFKMGRRFPVYFSERKDLDKNQDRRL